MQVVKCTCGADEMCFCGRCKGCGKFRSNEFAITSRECSCEWVAHTKGQAGSDTFEIVVIRKDNLHGFDSYGWYDPKKKLLISQSNGIPYSAISRVTWLLLVEVARKVAAELNAQEEKEKILANPDLYLWEPSTASILKEQKEQDAAIFDTINRAVQAGTVPKIKNGTNKQTSAKSFMDFPGETRTQKLLGRLHEALLNKDIPYVNVMRTDQLPLTKIIFIDQPNGDIDYILDWSLKFKEEPPSEKYDIMIETIWTAISNKLKISPTMKEGRPTITIDAGCQEVIIDWLK